MATVELSELVSYCLALAEGAGALIREVYHSPDAHGHGTVQTKEDDSPVTVADLRAQRFIMGSLAARYPSLLVIGEEDDAVVAQRDEVALLDPAVDAPAVELPQESTVPLAELVLWLDPLDGTRSFVDRRPADVTTLLGIAHRGSPLVGIVAFPLDDSRNTVWGGPRIGLHNVDSGHMTPLDTALTASPLVGLSYWVAEDPDKLAAVEAALPPQLFDLDTSAGGSGRLCVDVLEGKIDAARCHGFKWDAAAPAALLAAVGGQLTDMTGKALSYHAGTEQANRGGVILSLNDHWRYLGHEASSESPRLSSASEVTGSPPVAVSPASGVRTPTSPHDDSDGTGIDAKGPLFNVTKRGKVTYYMEGDGVISSLVTKDEPDGDLLIHFAGLTGGTSITNRKYLGHDDLVTMDPMEEIPRVFDCWSLWLSAAGICDSLDDVDMLEMHVFGCQPKSPNPLVDPMGYANECSRLRQAYATAYRKYFEERLPGHGYPCRYTVHLVDSPDTAASYEFYSVGLLQRSLQGNKTSASARL